VKFSMNQAVGSLMWGYTSPRDISPPAVAYEVQLKEYRWRRPTHTSETAEQITAVEGSWVEGLEYMHHVDN